MANDRNGELDAIISEVDRLRQALSAAESTWSPQIEQVNPDNRVSAINMMHYWAVRQYDLRSLQGRLATIGLSSLGRSESHVQATLEAITAAATALSHHDPAVMAPPAVGFADGSRLLSLRTLELLGPEPERRHTRIMVTLPSEAATDHQLIRDLMDRGMNLARINCAHDDPAAWAAMAEGVRRAATTSGASCRIAMDLAGPKLRTGPLEPGPQVVKLRPARDPLGRVTAAAWCWLTPDDNPSPPPRVGVATLPVAASWLARLQPLATFMLRDTRGKKRRFTVIQADSQGALACTERTTYVATGTELTTSGGHTSHVGILPAVEQFLTLFPGDTLLLTPDCTQAPAPPHGLPRIGCTLAEAFGHVRPGHTVLFDDGKIGGVVVDADDDTITVKITTAGRGGGKLRAGKGINLPDTTLPVPALTDLDREHLRFVSEYADLVEMSFVRSPRDVEDLIAALDELDSPDLGIIVKIETVQAFENLPAILLAAMRRPHTGVMIARGDLAVECGYERMAELQEEILWLCEAAHLPVIWATQVLDQLARSGQPSRAEITDAAMSARAECVMLNKGPCIVDAVAALDDILHRMTAHTDKQTTLMRPLRSWYHPD